MDRCNRTKQKYKRWIDVTGLSRSTREWIGTTGVGRRTIESTDATGLSRKTKSGYSCNKIWQSKGREAESLDRTVALRPQTGAKHHARLTSFLDRNVLFS